jgi:hypothetical protein
MRSESLLRWRRGPRQRFRRASRTVRRESGLTLSCGSGGNRLGCLFAGNGSCVLASLGGGGDNLHLLPIVGKFLTAIQARHVRSGQCPGLWPSPLSADGHREAVTRVPATEYCVKQSCQHGAPSTRLRSLGNSKAGSTGLLPTPTLNPLDSGAAKIVSPSSGDAGR